MKIDPSPQGSAEWLFARAGKITASECDAILTPKFAAREGQGVDSYLAKKVAERFLGQPLGLEDFDGTFATRQGQLAEGPALGWFNFTYDCNAKPVGFCITDDTRCGASPDAILEGREEGLELKFPTPEIQTKYLLAGKIPDAYICQIHFSLFVTGFKRWHFVAWSNRLPSLVLTVERDEAIQAKIKEAVDSFYVRFDAALAKLNHLKEQSA